MHDNACEQLLKFVAFGLQQEANLLLNKYPHLAREKGDVVDCGDREFKNITALQYSLWALDHSMCKMLAAHLPEEDLLYQVQDLEQNSSINFHNKQISWQQLIDYLNHLYDNYDCWTPEEIMSYFNQFVGKEQRLLPAHVIQKEYLKENFFGNCTYYPTKEQLLGNQLKSPIIPSLRFNLSFLQPQPIHTSEEYRKPINCWYTREKLVLGTDFAWSKNSISSGIWTIMPTKHSIYLEANALQQSLELKIFQCSNFIKEIINSSSTDFKAPTSRLKITF